MKKASVDSYPPPPLEKIEEVLQKKDLSVKWLAGDGSDRCYYRIHQNTTEHTWVLMQLSDLDAKDLQNNGYDWINIGKIIQHKIRIPKLIAAIPDYAALIIEDYGDTMMETIALDYIQNQKYSDLDNLYEKTFGIISQMCQFQEKPDEPWCQRAFDKGRYVWELNFFIQNFVEPVCRTELSSDQFQKFRSDVDNLGEYLGSMAKYFVHRDFHSRNIMIKNKELAVIDFQDARLGPPAYDLVSICFDSYLPLDQSQRISYLEEGLRHLGDISPAIGREAKLSWKATLLQRQLKALGSFGYLTIKKNRGNYLKYVSPAIASISNNLVGDERWPFLSCDLIEILNEKSKEFY